MQRSSPVHALHWLAAVCLLCTSMTAGADEARISEYRVKTAFLYNFSRFVTWPAIAMHERTEFSVCVIGTDPFGEQLDKLTGKSVHARTLVVNRLSSIAMLDSCHLLYISDDAEMVKVLSVVREQPVLTVSDVENFTEQGGIIQFKLVQSKVRFRINAEAAGTAGLNISSKLLSLAIDVSGRQ
jgi:hypothetical protein